MRVGHPWHGVLARTADGAYAPSRLPAVARGISRYAPVANREVTGGYRPGQASCAQRVVIACPAWAPVDTDAETAPDAGRPLRAPSPGAQARQRPGRPWSGSPTPVGRIDSDGRSVLQLPWLPDPWRRIRSRGTARVPGTRATPGGACARHARTAHRHRSGPVRGIRAAHSRTGPAYRPVPRGARVPGPVPARFRAGNVTAPPARRGRPVTYGEGVALRRRRTA